MTDDVREGKMGLGEPRRLQILCPLCEGKIDNCDVCEDGYVDLLEFLRRLYILQKSLIEVAPAFRDGRDYAND